jgi:hypothetical protein
VTSDINIWKVISVLLFRFTSLQNALIWFFFTF